MLDYFSQIVSNPVFPRKIFSFPVIFIYKCFNFCYFLQIFLISSWFTATDLFYWWIFCFLSNQENLHLIHHDQGLIYDIYNMINEHNRTSLSFIGSRYFDIFFEWFKKFFYNIICFIVNFDFYIITFWVHYMLSIVICRRNKVICYCQLNFQRVRFFEVINDVF